MVFYGVDTATIIFASRQLDLLTYSTQLPPPFCTPSKPTPYREPLLTHQRDFFRFI